MCGDQVPLEIRALHERLVAKVALESAVLGVRATVLSESELPCESHGAQVARVRLCVRLSMDLLKNHIAESVGTLWEEANGQVLYITQSIGGVLRMHNDHGTQGTHTRTRTFGSMSITIKMHTLRRTC